MTDVTKLDWTDRDEWYAVPFEEKIDIIKSAVTLPDVVEMFGYDLERGDKIRPPWNAGERTASTHIYEDHFYDYSSGKHGDVFDFMKEVDLADEDGEGQVRTISKMMYDIKERAVNCGKEPGDVEPVVVRKLENLADQMPSGPVPFCAGVDVRPFGLMQDGAGTVYVPHEEYVQDPSYESTGILGHRVYGIKLRSMTGAKSAVPGSQFTHRLYSPRGWNAGLHRSMSCVICEGESDSWAMWWQMHDKGIDVFALPSGAAAWKDHWLDDLAPYRNVYLCFDNDRAGKSALDKVSRKVGYEKAHTLKVPGIYNDAREAIQAGWVPRTQVQVGTV